MVIADAGQAFEALESTSISAACDRVFEHAQQSGGATITVMKGARPQVTSGGDPGAKHRDRYVFYLRTVRKMVEIYLCMSYYRLGAWIWKQRQGVPIGGRLSQTILETVLQSKEHAYDDHVVFRSVLFGAGRYVDDLVLMSRQMCRQCLCKRIVDVYGDSITFDVDYKQDVLHGTVMQKYLDFIMFIGPGFFECVALHKNFVYAFSGDDNTMQKHM